MDAYASLGLLGLVLLAANLLLSPKVARVDLTEQKVYTISPATAKTLRELDDLVHIKAFISEQLPPQFVNLSQQVKDLLVEYQTYGGDKISVSYLDPKAGADATAEAQTYGIQPIQFSDVSQEKLEIAQGFLGLAILYEDRQEVIPFITETSNLEYDLTAAIKKALRQTPINLAYLTGHQEASPYQDLRLVDSNLKKLYQTQPLNLAELKKIPGDISTIMIVNPQTEYSEEEKYLLDQFLMAGRGMLIALSKTNVSSQLIGQPEATGLSELLESYGLTLSSGLVLDQINEIAGFNTESGSIFVNYPYWVKVLPENLTADSPITARLQSLVFPWTSALTISPEEESHYQILARSSESSWLSENIYNLSPVGITEPSESQASHILAVSATGPLNSAYLNKERPVTEEGEDFLAQTNKARLVVISSSLLPTDGFGQRFGENALFFLNAVDFVSQDESLAEIRVKQGLSVPLKNLTDQQKHQIRYFGLAYPLVIVIVVAIATNFWRQRRLRKARL